MRRPDYLLRKKINHIPVTYQWDQWSATGALRSDDQRVHAELAAISLRGSLALSAAMGEWACSRFSRVIPGSDLETHLELSKLVDAVWAAMFDLRYVRKELLVFDQDMNDPVRGPIQEVKNLLRKILETYEEVDYGIVRHVSALASLIRYVTPGSKAFQVWFKCAVENLPALSQPSVADVARSRPAVLNQAASQAIEIWGSLVPREAFDPDFELTKNNPDELLTNLLPLIKSSEKEYPNRFLRSRSELIALGLSGEPYRYQP
jgi:hypothetical protein